MISNRPRATTADHTASGLSQRRHLDITEYQSQSANEQFPDRPFSHASISKLSQPQIRLHPEGVEMCHINLYKKETDYQVKLLQNRLDLLRRQEREMQRTSSCNFRNHERLLSVRRHEQRDQKQI